MSWVEAWPCPSSAGDGLNKALPWLEGSEAQCCACLSRLLSSEARTFGEGSVAVHQGPPLPLTLGIVSSGR